MTKFSGFDDWIPIFRGGKQIDSSGMEHDGDALIEKAVAQFDAGKHEPPAVIGHPTSDGPAWGWVEGLKKGTDALGNLLLAKFRQVQPEFATMVERGLFKKRSAAFYPDGRLRHVGFLGAMPPAVKGLPDVAFAAGDAASFEFTDVGNGRDRSEEGRDRSPIDPTGGAFREHAQQGRERSPIDPTGGAFRERAQQQEEENNMTFKEKLKAVFGEMINKLPDDGPAVPDKPTWPAPPAPAFTEADLEKAKAEAAQKEREKLTAEFAERAHKAKLATRKTEIAQFCESLIQSGKITPATVKFGLPEILFSLAESDNQIEFGEDKAKVTAFDRMKALLESAQPLVTFGEMATRGKDTGDPGQAGEKLDKITRDKMKANTALTYSAAFAEAQSEHPELAREYIAQIQRV